MTTLVDKEKHALAKLFGVSVYVIRTIDATGRSITMECNGVEWEASHADTDPHFRYDICRCKCDWKSVSIELLRTSWNRVKDRARIRARLGLRLGLGSLIRTATAPLPYLCVRRCIVLMHISMTLNLHDTGLVPTRGLSALHLWKTEFCCLAFGDFISYLATSIHDCLCFAIILQHLATFLQRFETQF